MNLTKVFIIILVITLLALVYVYQQSKIIQMAYREQEKLCIFESLVDKNNKLRYNLNWRTSLILVAGAWQERDFEWPHQGQLVSLPGSTRAAADWQSKGPRWMPAVQQISEDNNQTKRAQSLFTRLFGLKSQAEATSIKPR